MALLKDGLSLNRKERSRPILTLRKETDGSENNAQLGGIEQDSHTAKASEAQRWGDALCAARNHWDIARRQLPRDAAGWVRGGFLAGKGKLSRVDAENLLRRAFADLSERGAAQ